MNPFVSILMNAYLDGLQLSSIYNLIYLRAFEEAVAEQRMDVFGEETTTTVMSTANRGTLFSNKLELTYNRWLNNVDKELERELKSEHFTLLLSNYTLLLLELHSLFRKIGYPIDYLDWMFGWFVKSRMVFSSIPKESHLAPFNVIFRKGKARLLHYRNNDQEISSSMKKQKQPLLIVYAPINSFHILDLNSKRSVIRDLLASSGLDIYLLDWGYPDSSDNHLSLEDYLGYVADSVKVINEQTGANTISILGYCWGAYLRLFTLPLILKEVRNLVLMASSRRFQQGRHYTCNMV